VPVLLSLAKELRARSLEGDAAEAWEQALRSIRDPSECPQHSGLELEPQLGLVPIGRDPDSKLREFAHPLSGEPARRDADGKLQLAPETGVVLVLIPGGTFGMGARRSEAGGPNDDPWAIPFLESPPHAVAVPPFFLSKYELTLAQWWRACHEVPGASGAHESVLPVQGISWVDATRVARRLGSRRPTRSSGSG